MSEDPLVTRYVNEARAALVAVRVPKDAAPMAAYMKHVAPFLGVRAPARRSTLKAAWRPLDALSAAQLVATAHALQAEPERELHYAAADLCALHLKQLDERFIPDHAAALLSSNPWWDTIDLWGSDVINPLCQRHDHLETIRCWHSSEDRWLIRAAIQHQRGRRDKTDLPLLFELCAPYVEHEEFFIAKAIGWALRDAAKLDPEATRTFLNTHPNMNQIARREARRGLGDPK